MAFSPFDKMHNLIGIFTESTKGFEFEYEPNDPSDSWLPMVNYPHRVWVATRPINDQGWRYAHVKKTVAYIVVDEDDYGQPVIEKWAIKKNRIYIRKSS